MLNFTYSIPTKVHFGKGQISHLSELRESGERVLMVYGGGSIRRTGIYDAAMRVLSENHMTVYELNGVEPNPRITSVRAGIELCRKNNIDMVLAIGGGSVIDCAKIVAAGALYEGDAWDLVLYPDRIRGALPIYTVLTAAATGSEMDAIAVISDMEKNEKWATAAPVLAPKMSVLDPEYTMTTSAKQTSAGTADIISHTFENYFTNVRGATLQAGLCEAVLKTCFRYGPVALEDPKNYEARANLMWCSSLAINGLLNDGADVPWSIHAIEHELSAFYDVTHGEGLAILTPVWMRYVLKKDASKMSDFAAYGRNIWGILGKSDEDTAYAAIEATERFFFETMCLPRTLRDVGICEKTKFEIMAQKSAKGREGCYIPLSSEDILEILNAAF